MRLVDAGASALLNLAVLAGIPFLALFAYQKLRHQRRFLEVARRAGLQLGNARYLGYSLVFAAVGVTALVAWPPPLGGDLQREHDFAASEAELGEAVSSIRTVLKDERVEMPRTAVLDVGIIAGRGWAVVEQNAAWGSGLYGCDPELVLEVLRHAAIPSQ